MTSTGTPFLIDYALVIASAPVGICITNRRTIERCNVAAATIFGYSIDTLTGMNFSGLYPSIKESKYENDSATIEISSVDPYSVEKIMLRSNGELFWCRINRAACQGDGVNALRIWIFTEICERTEISQSFSARERQIAPMLIAGKTSKIIAQEIGLSFRTVDYYRLRMMRKLAVKNYKELASRLVKYR